MVGHASWICSSFFAIYAGNQGRPQTVGEVQSSCFCIKAKVHRYTAQAISFSIFKSLDIKDYDKIMARRMQKRSERLL